MLILSILVVSPCYSLSQKPITVWNNMMTSQENLIISGNLVQAETVLEKTVTYSADLVSKGYSLDFLIESSLSLAKLYDLEGKTSQAIEMYKYVDSLLNDSKYKLKGEISVEINRLDSVLQNQYQSKLVQMERYNEYLTEKNKPKSYDGTNFLTIQDIITTVDNIMYAVRY